MQIRISAGLRRVAASLAGLCLMVQLASADVRLPAVIGDHMVLQQDADVTLWGWAEPAEAVAVTPSWDGKPVSATADPQGRWKVMVRTPASGGPHTLSFAARNTIQISDVLIGEVWLASGQSNMEWPVASSLNAKEEIAAADHPQIRLFTVERATATAPGDDVVGKWEVCSPQTVGKFSGVAYFFGRALHLDLHVPVGLVASSWGGTEIEKWIPEPAMLSNPELAASITARREALKTYDAALAAWRKENDAADPGTAGGWQSPTLDDHDWTPYPVYKTWDTADLAAFDGVAWFRGTAEVPASWAGQSATLELGAIDDQDRTYWNGKLIGSTAEWSTPRVYALSGDDLKPGANSIVIRVHDTGGLGGFTPGADQPCLKRGSDRVPVGGWRYRIGVTQSSLKAAPQSPAPQHSVLYNAMIAPLTSYPVRGFLWYQGESNVPRAAQYATAFPLMIESWRQAWRRDDLPFYFVQIAPFSGYTGWNLAPGTSAELRESQRQTLRVPHTGMVVTTDLTPDVTDIHPPDKTSVGKRLARWAMADVYHQRDVVRSGPLYRTMKVEEGAIRLSFDYVESGIEARGGALTGFTLAGEDRKFVPAEAKIDGRDVRVSAPGVKKPVAVRFAWEDAPIPSFFNRDGLPASPFRTDDWPLTTAAVKW